MNKKDFDNALAANASLIEEMRQAAHKLHADVNQHYDKTRPYGFHLDMVAQKVREHGAEACASPADVPAIMMGAYYHDSIEDARLTYNNVLAAARRWLDEDHALMAAEIAYALTNEKGRTRAERANDRYYAGISATPYAPLVKMADRLANAEYSATGNSKMRDVYAAEMPHFIAAIAHPATDPRLRVPVSMLTEAQKYTQA